MSTGTVEVVEREVAQGECLSSIAQQYGFDWQFLWNHSLNADLRKLRKTPNVLKPGDVLHIPAKEIKHEDRSAEARHNFQVTGVPTKLILKLMRAGKPLANENYTLRIASGAAITDKTDGNGKIEKVIPAGETHASLLLSNGLEEYSLKLAHLDPVETTTGLQARLRNLGFYGGPVDDCDSPLLTAALKEFQKKNGLNETGTSDDSTRQKLMSVHGS